MAKQKICRKGSPKLQVYLAAISDVNYKPRRKKIVPCATCASWWPTDPCHNYTRLNWSSLTSLWRHQSSKCIDSWLPTSKKTKTKQSLIFDLAYKSVLSLLARFWQPRNLAVPVILILCERALSTTPAVREFPPCIILCWQYFVKCKSAEAYVDSRGKYTCTCSVNPPPP